MKKDRSDIKIKVKELDKQMEDVSRVRSLPSAGLVQVSLKMFLLLSRGL